MGSPPLFQSTQVLQSGGRPFTHIEVRAAGSIAVEGFAHLSRCFLQRSHNPCPVQNKFAYSVYSACGTHARQLPFANANCSNRPAEAQAKVKQTVHLVATSPGIHYRQGQKVGGLPEEPKRSSLPARPQHALFMR